MRKHSTCLKTTLTIAGIVMVAALCACAPQTSGQDDTSVAAVAGADENDQVVMGALDTYSPEDEQQAGKGTSLGFDEESNLQQEKTAGASGGAITSNVEALGPGITAYSEGETPGFTASTGEPPEIDHGDGVGSDCLSCHDSADADGSASLISSDYQIPESHRSAAIGNDQCLSCHSYAGE